VTSSPFVTPKLYWRKVWEKKSKKKGGEGGGLGKMRNAGKTRKNRGKYK